MGQEVMEKLWSVPPMYWGLWLSVRAALPQHELGWGCGHSFFIIIFYFWWCFTPRGGSELAGTSGQHYVGFHWEFHLQN